MSEVGNTIKSGAVADANEKNVSIVEDGFFASKFKINFLETNFFLVNKIVLYCFRSSSLFPQFTNYGLLPVRDL